jgi:hypothetical protein
MKHRRSSHRRFGLMARLRHLDRQEGIASAIGHCAYGERLGPTRPGLAAGMLPAHASAFAVGILAATAHHRRDRAAGSQSTTKGEYHQAHAGEDVTRSRSRAQSHGIPVQDDHAALFSGVSVWRAACTIARLIAKSRSGAMANLPGSRMIPARSSTSAG